MNIIDTTTNTNIIAAQSGTNIAPLFVTALAIGLLFFFMIVRPQKRNMAKHQKLVAGLAPGDEIITSGGIYGTITRVEDDSIILEISPGTNIKVAKKSIAMKKVSSDVAIETNDTSNDSRSSEEE